MKRPSKDAGLDEIDRWHQAFVAGHAQRLRDDGLDDEAFARAFAEIQRLADAICERLKSDHLAWTTR